MRIRCALLVTAFLAAACSRPAPPALQWERINPLPTDADLHALASARGLTVAAGEGGTILTSPDGRTWTLRPTETTDDLFGITAAPAGFVAVGDGTILTSGDGVAWAPRTGAAGKDLRAAACGPQICVAVGDGGAAVTGKLTGKWSPVTVGTANDLLSIAYRNGRFVVVGAKGAAFASADGRVWAPLKLTLPEVPQGFYNDLSSVMVTQDTWVIGGAGFDSSFVLTSRDGETWDLRDAGKGWSRHWATDGSRILRLTFREKEKSRSFTSADLGATWQAAEISMTFWPLLYAMTWDGAQFLIAGSNGAIMASGDGAWEQRLPQGHRLGWSDIAFGDGRFVAIANGDVAVSDDGRTWNLHPRPKSEPLYLRSIARGPDRFVATGLGIYTSVDGVTWTQQQAPSDWPIGPVVWGNGRYVALRGNQTLTSVDGTAWQLGPALGADRYFDDLVVGDGGYLAYDQTMDGKQSEFYTSADGLTWTSQGLQPRIWSVAFGKGLYVAFTVSGTVITSSDGREWTEVEPPVREGFHIFFKGDRFVAMGSESVLISPDGRKWTVDGRQPARHGITGMAFGHGRLVAVGDVGSIIVATPAK